MDRRFFAWLLLTTSLFFIYLSTRPQIAPEEGEGEAVEQAAAQAPGDDPLLRTPPPREQPDGAEEVTESSPADAFPTRVVTLGSMDPNSEYRLLVTVTSRGAGVERAEFVEQRKPGRFRFRALEHDGGYLGYLALAVADQGLLVRAVPPGSPAATATCPHAPAGLEPGDILTAVDGQPTRSLAAYDQAVERTKVGRPVELTILRPSPTGQGAGRQLVFTATASEAPLDVIRKRPRPSEWVEGNFQTPCLRTTLASIGATRVPAGQLALPALAPMLDTNWETRPLEVPGGDGVEFFLPLDRFLQATGRPANLELVKRYRLFPATDGRDGYLLDVETELVNRNEEEVIIALRQEGLSGLTLEGWWYSVKISPYMFSGAGQRDVMYQSQLEGHRLVTTRSIVKRAQEYPGQPFSILFSENEPAEARTVRYIGLDSPYFNASILPYSADSPSLGKLRQGGALALANVKRLKKAQLQAANVGFWFDSQDEVVPPGQSLTHRYRVFIGPKASDVLAAHGLERAIEYGWFPWIAKPLSAILHFFHWIVGNYGLSIVMLTVLVRGCMFPLGRKAAINAQKMQELQPELKRINEMYKDNMEKRAKAMQELYAKHNFKPLAGCLPMFIQLPIFIGLYRCLSVDISLRQEPLIPGIDWCSNLAGPDMLLDWSSWMPEFIAGRGTGWLGPYFNILPMVTVALFLAQQKLLMPKATDEQTRMTQNMMQVMTVFMGVLFFKVPSGLCIYFITSSMWSLVERQLVKRMMPATATAPPNPPPSSGAKASSKRQERKKPQGTAASDKPRTKLQELKELLEKPAVRSSTQRNPQKGPPPKNRNRKRRK